MDTLTFSFFCTRAHRCRRRQRRHHVRVGSSSGDRSTAWRGVAWRGMAWRGLACESMPSGNQRRGLGACAGASLDGDSVEGVEVWDSNGRLRRDSQFVIEPDAHGKVWPARQRPRRALCHLEYGVRVPRESRGRGE